MYRFQEDISFGDPFFNPPQYHSFFIQASYNRHLNYYYFSIMNKAAINILYTRTRFYVDMFSAS